MNNQDKLNHLSSSIYNFICDYRKYNNWYFYDNEIPNLESLKEKLKDEEITLSDDVEKLKNPEYAARYAREKYFYSKNGEKILKID